MSNLSYSNANPIDWAWKVDASGVKSSDIEVKSALMDLTKPVYVAKSNDGLGVVNTTSASGSTDVLAFAQKLTPQDLGDDAYKKQHGVKLLIMAGLWLMVLPQLNSLSL